MQTRQSKQSRKWIFHGFFQFLFVACISRLVHAQSSGAAFTGNPLFGNNTLLPTVLAEATSNPTTSPTTPTMPTRTPSLSPTATVSPSNSPSTTFEPSHQPSVSLRPTSSMQPSRHPSDSPSGAPTHHPSATPSESPTISSQPTISSAPTISFQPTLSAAPSRRPSASPSDSPSDTPTVSMFPSSQPSTTPSGAPTISPEPSLAPSISSAPSVSAPPSLSPSVSPTTHEPSDAPSASPTLPPSIPPSESPTAVPSSTPTLTIYRVVRTNMYMYLNDMPGLLNATQEKQWIDITQKHILNYYDQVNHLVPGILPVNVSSVYGSLIVDQKFTPKSRGLGELEIQYVQGIKYGLFDPNANRDVIEQQIFVIPFEDDAETYIIDLITTFDLHHWVEVSGVYIGNTQSPTLSPVAPLRESHSGPKLSKRALRVISACIVLSSVLLVAFLFWDRHRKEKLYMQTHARDFETMEYDNTGQPIDWRNPYSPSGTMNGGSPQSQPGASPPQDQAVGPICSTRSNSPQTTTSSTVRAAIPSGTERSWHNRAASLPVPVPGHGRQSNRHSSGANHVLMTPPPLPIDHARHVSVAETDMTDLTFSDGGGGGRSENGSDGAAGAGHVPMLPAISDEPYGSITWSPLHIPEEDLYSSSESQDDGSDPGVNIPRYGDSKHGNSLSGFQMQVQDLE